MRSVLALLVLVAACGDDDGGAPDAGGDAPSVDRVEPEAPAPPMRAMPPAEPTPPTIEAWACPVGWVRGEDEPDSRCAPVPSEGEPPSTCPEGDFPDVPGAIYVRPSATGGDGSSAMPFGTIAAAIASANAGDTIVLSRGVFDETVHVPAGVTLTGACASATVIAPSGVSEETAALELDGAIARNLRVRADRIGVLVRGESTFERAVIERAASSGIVVEADAHATLRTLLVRGVQPIADGTGGRGLTVRAGGNANVGRTVFSDVKQIAIAAFGPGTTTLSDVAILDVAPQTSDGAYGAGIVAFTGARLEATRVAIHGCSHAAVQAQDAGTNVVLRDVHVDDVFLSSEGFARAITIIRGAALDAERVVVLRAADTGLRVRDRGTRARLVDLLIADAAPFQDGAPGRGIEIASGAEVELERALLVRNGDGIVVEDATLKLTDLRVAESTAQPGMALVAQGAADVQGDRLHVDRANEVGVHVRGAGSRAILRDVIVEGTTQRADGTFGAGLYAYEMGRIEATRVVLRDNHASSAFAHGAALVLRDATIERTRPQEDGRYGRAITAQAGASLEVERARLADHHELTVSIVGAHTTGTLTDLAISGGAEDPDGEACGLFVASGAEVALRRIEIASAAFLGAQIAGAGTIATIADLHIEDTRSLDLYGAGLQVIEGAQLDGERLLFAHNRSVALQAIHAGTSVDVSDVAIADTTSADGMGEQARGLNVQDGASLVGTRVHIERSHEAALTILGGASARLTEVSLLDTLARECAASGCAEAPAGIGAGVYDDSMLAIERFRIERSSLVGVQIGELASLALRAGEVVTNPVGVSIGDRAFDLGSIAEDVVFRDNVTNLDATALPVPAPLAPRVMIGADLPNE